MAANLGERSGVGRSTVLYSCNVSSKVRQSGFYKWRAQAAVLLDHAFFLFLFFKGLKISQLLGTNRQDMRNRESGMSKNPLHFLFNLSFFLPCVPPNVQLKLTRGASTF